MPCFQLEAVPLLLFCSGKEKYERCQIILSTGLFLWLGPCRQKPNTERLCGRAILSQHFSWCLRAKHTCPMLSHVFIAGGGILYDVEVLDLRDSASVCEAIPDVNISTIYPTANTYYGQVVLWARPCSGKAGSGMKSRPIAPKRRAYPSASIIAWRRARITAPKRVAH